MSEVITGIANKRLSREGERPVQWFYNGHPCEMRPEVEWEDGKGRVCALHCTTLDGVTTRVPSDESGQYPGVTYDSRVN